MVLDGLIISCGKIPLFFQDHRDTKSFSEMLKIGLSLSFYYYCSIDSWLNWPRKLFVCLIFYFFYSYYIKTAACIK